MKKYFLILLAIVSGCGKEPSKPLQTIYPLSYLPVYPGSWWRYLKGNGDTVTYKTENNYMEHSYPSYELNNSYTDVVKVPFWNGKPIYGYSTPAENHVQQPNDEGLSQVAYLSEHTGDYLLVYSYKETSWREVGTTDTALIVNGVLYNHVIRVDAYQESPFFYNYPKTLYEISYYAKDVGLVRTDDPIDTSITLQLIDFFINH